MSFCLSQKLNIYLLLSLHILKLTVANSLDGDRVVGGFACGTDEFKFIVSLQRRAQPYHFCGGSLVRLDWVLTAAHCLLPFQSAPRLITAAAGVSVTRKTGMQSRRAEQLIVHPRFGYADMQNDIGLIFLASPFTISSNIDVVKIIPKVLRGDMTNYCGTGLVMGFGMTEVYSPELGKGSEENFVYTGNLSCVQLQLIEQKRCEALVFSPMSPTVFCAAYLPGGRDACKGDSGGPFVCQGFQVGLVSSGFGCALPNKPAFYTRLDTQLDFIEHTIKKMKGIRKQYVGVKRVYSSGSDIDNCSIDFFSIQCLILFFNIRILND